MSRGRSADVPVTLPSAPSEACCPHMARMNRPITEQPDEASPQPSPIERPPRSSYHSVLLQAPAVLAVVRVLAVGQVLGHQAQGGCGERSADQVQDQ